MPEQHPGLLNGLEEILDPAHTAIVVVDMQNDFCDGGSLAVKGSLDIIPIINKLREDPLFDVIVKTRDYH